MPDFVINSFDWRMAKRSYVCVHKLSASVIRNYPEQSRFEACSVIFHPLASRFYFFSWKALRSEIGFLSGNISMRVTLMRDLAHKTIKRQYIVQRI